MAEKAAAAASQTRERVRRQLAQEEVDFRIKNCVIVIWSPHSIHLSFHSQADCVIVIWSPHSIHLSFPSQADSQNKDERIQKLEKRLLFVTKVPRLLLTSASFPAFVAYSTELFSSHLSMKLSQRQSWGFNSQSLSHSGERWMCECAQLL